jgi:hypothetical protein
MIPHWAPECRPTGQIVHCWSFRNKHRSAFTSTRVVLSSSTSRRLRPPGGGDAQRSTRHDSLPAARSSLDAIWDTVILWDMSQCPWTIRSDMNAIAAALGHLDELGQAKGGWDTARRHPRIGLEKCATLRREKVRRGWTPSPHHRGGTDRWSRGPVRVGARYWSGTEGRSVPSSPGCRLRREFSGERHLPEAEARQSRLLQGIRHLWR